MTYVLVHLDDYHLGDPLFARALARDVAEHTGPLLLLHGAGEGVERALEAQGLTGVEARHAPEHATVVERTIRDQNRRLVHELNEAGVPAVGILGVDRGLLRKTDRGDLVASDVNWLRRLTHSGVVPVLGTLVGSGEGGVVEAGADEVAAALVGALQSVAGSEAVLVALHKGAAPGLEVDGVPALELTLEDFLSTSKIADSWLLAAVSGRVPTVVTSRSALRGDGVPKGTRVRA